jgi:hypothetical protein
MKGSARSHFLGISVRRGENMQGSGESGYNLPMALALIAMRVLEVMFFVGLAGSTVVVLISFAEDAKELFGDD